MLSIFKDAAQMYPVTPQRPLTFLLPEVGGKKEVTIWIVATGLSGSTLIVTPVGSDQAQFPVMLRPGGQDWVPGAPTVSNLTDSPLSLRCQSPYRLYREPAPNTI